MASQVPNEFLVPQLFQQSEIILKWHLEQAGFGNYGWQETWLEQSNAIQSSPSVKLVFEELTAKIEGALSHSGYTKIWTVMNFQICESQDKMSCLQKHCQNIHSLALATALKNLGYNISPNTQELAYSRSNLSKAVSPLIPEKDSIW